MVVVIVVVFSLPALSMQIPENPLICIHKYLLGTR